MKFFLLTVLVASVAAFAPNQQTIGFRELSRAICVQTTNLNMAKTVIGLDEEKSNTLVVDLNTLLANFQLYYQNLRGLHWNIKGRNFFELHAKFEELYTDSQEKIDLIAERVLTLQGKPTHTFEDYMKLGSVPVGKSISQDEEAVTLVVNSLTELLKIEREILETSDDAEDEGTNSMIGDFISEQEKTVWMLNAWLAN